MRRGASPSSPCKNRSVSRDRVASAVVGVAAEERVAAAVVAGRRVHGPACGGVEDGFEPRGAALGEARDEDVGGARLEAGVDLGEAQQGDLGEPEAVEQAEGRKHRALWPLRKRVDDVGKVGRKGVVAVGGHHGELVALAGRRRLTSAPGPCFFGDCSHASS